MFQFCFTSGQQAPGRGAGRVEPDDHQQVKDSGDHHLHDRTGGRHRDSLRSEGKVLYTASDQYQIRFLFVTVTYPIGFRWGALGLHLNFQGSVSESLPLF